MSIGLFKRLENKGQLVGGDRQVGGYFVPFAESTLSEAEGLRASAHLFCAVTEGCGDGRIEEKRAALLLSVTGPA